MCVYFNPDAQNRRPLYTKSWKLLYTVYVFFKLPTDPNTQLCMSVKDTDSLSNKDMAITCNRYHFEKRALYLKPQSFTRSVFDYSLTSLYLFSFCITIEIRFILSLIQLQFSQNSKCSRYNLMLLIATEEIKQFRVILL